MKISKTEYFNRLVRFRMMLIEHDIDNFILTEEESIYYLTGKTYKSLERLFILVVSVDSTYFVIPKMEESHLNGVVNVDEIIVYKEYPAPCGETWRDKLIDCMSHSSVIAVEKKCPVEVYIELENFSNRVLSSALLDELRYIKSEAEICLIKQAASYCDKAVGILERTCYFGMSELEVFSIGNTIQRQIIKETDFDYLATAVLMAVWPSRISHQAHGIPRVDDLLVEGAHISLAFFRVNGYAAELERTFFTAKPTLEQREAFNIMMEARRLAYEWLRPGVSGHEVDGVVREFLQQEGMGEYIMHRTGHGIGLGNHEGPFIAVGDDTILKRNMVVSIEPGIYIEGVGGFRHSDTVKITDNGYELLTHAPDKLEDLIFTQKRFVSVLKGLLIRKLYGIKKREQLD